MKKLKFIYERRLLFQNEVEQHYFSLRCIPLQNELQQINHLDFEMSPYEGLSQSKDSFGNHLYTGCIKKPHNQFYFRVEGQAMVQGGPCKDEKLVSLFKYPSQYTQLEGQLKNYFETLDIPAFHQVLDKALFLMQALSHEMTYETGYTDIHTTASMAFELRKGVCQDYAHIFLSLCRGAYIPARYVVGFMLGEGETHAWVEVYSDGLWYGLDPTNNTYVDDTYIKLAVGRDYGDCNIDKGLFYGYTRQKQEIMVRVEACYD